MSFARHDLPLLAFLGASLCTPVQAADFDVGVSLVCDTQTQVERFVTLLTGDAGYLHSCAAAHRDRALAATMESGASQMKCRLASDSIARCCDNGGSALRARPA